MDRKLMFYLLVAVVIGAAWRWHQNDRSAAFQEGYNERSLEGL